MHWVFVCSITADYFDAPFAAHHHLVPLEHRLVRERRGESFVEIDHHFRDAAFGGGILRWSPPSLNCWRSDDCTLSRFSTSPSISEVFRASSGGSSTASPISRAETPSLSIRSNSSSRAIPAKRRASAACSARCATPAPITGTPRHRKTGGRGAARRTGLPAELGGRPRGSARFRTEPAAAGTAAQIQQTIELAKLQEIAEALIREEDVRTGSRPGPGPDADRHLVGARAKAVVEDGEGLWIAKFNRPDGRWNNARVERAMLELAKTCGVSVATSRVETIGGKDVLLVKRFDREKTDKGYQRARMISGLTLLRAEEAAEMGDR
jgi:HipA-like C-terminal domain